MRPKSLLELAGVTPTPPRLADSVVVVIDAQREYVDGTFLPLCGDLFEALAEACELRSRAECVPRSGVRAGDKRPSADR